MLYFVLQGARQQTFRRQRHLLAFLVDPPHGYPFASIHLDDHPRQAEAAFFHQGFSAAFQHLGVDQCQQPLPHVDGYDPLMDTDLHRRQSDTALGVHGFRNIVN